jgi:hypothetical protein
MNGIGQFSLVEITLLRRFNLSLELKRNKMTNQTNNKFDDELLLKNLLDQNINHEILKSQSSNLSKKAEWINNTYFANLAQEKASSLSQLHNATNWGVTLITAALVAVISRQAFPDAISFYTLLLTFLIGVHFFTRTIKGYINVIRFSFLQRIIVDSTLMGELKNKNSELEEAIIKYHIEWLLPLRKIDVIIKGLLELGYGYILGIVILLLIYTTTVVSIDRNEWIILGISLFLVLVEIALLFRSPYMRRSAPNEKARRQR